MLVPLFRLTLLYDLWAVCVCVCVCIYIYIYCVNGLYEVLSIDDGNKVQNPWTML